MRVLATAKVKAVVPSPSSLYNLLQFLRMYRDWIQLLKKLTARLDYQDYKLDINNKILRIAILNNKWIELKLQWYNYLNKYFSREWRLKEILMS